VRLRAAAVLLAFASVAYASQVGNYPNATALTGTERFLADQAGISVNITPEQIATYVGTGYGTTQFTTSGSCAPSVMPGQPPNAGIMTMTRAGGCTIVVAINGATGYTAPNGFNCWMGDRNAITVPAWIESSSTTMTATFSVPPQVNSGDTLSFHCEKF